MHGPAAESPAEQDTELPDFDTYTDLDTNLEEDSPSESPPAAPASPSQPSQQSQPPVKRGRGRPPKHPRPVDGQPVSATQTQDSGGQSKPKAPPKPPHFKYGSTYPSGQRPDNFFSYLHNLDPRYQDYMVLYVYRHWPVVRRFKPNDPKDKGTTQIDKLTVGEAPHTLDDMLHRYGSGDYTILANDQVVLKKTITRCNITGLRDEHHPPVVDLDTLVLTDPTNASYLKDLRLRGVHIPGDPESQSQSEGEDMAAVTELTRTVENLTDKVVRVSERAMERQEQSAPPQAPLPVDADAAQKGMAIVAKGAEMAQGMIKSALDRASELTTKQADPLALLQAAVGFAEKIVPKPDGTMAEVIKMFSDREKLLTDHLFQLQAERIASTERQIELLRSQPAAQSQAPGSVLNSTPQTMPEMLRQLREVRGELKDILGVGGEEDKGDSGPGWVQHLPLILTGITVVGGMIANVIHNWAVARTGIGAPAAPPPPQMDPQTAEQLSASGVQVPGSVPGPVGVPRQSGGPGPQAPPPNVRTQSQPQSQEEIMRGYHMLLSQLEHPLLDSLNQGDTGYDFAGKMIEWQGRMVYDALREQGKDVLITIIRTYPPIWNVVVTIPQRFDLYLDEFLSYDEWLANQPPEQDVLPPSTPSSPGPGPVRRVIRRPSPGDSTPPAA